jgi:NADH:ubiquinone oxidoreductase subunit 2 (subunit N)
VTFGLALAGLAGVPPLAGFAGKWFFLTHALGVRAPDAQPSGRPDAWLYTALVIFLLNNLAALGYFLPVIGALYAPSIQETRRERIFVSLWMIVPLVILGALVLILGLYPGPFLGWTADIGAYLLGS